MFRLILAFLAAALISNAALAHVEPGRYQGTVASTGAACFIDIIAIRFEGNIPHPLNERVDVRLDQGMELTLSHLPQMSRTDKKVRPEGGKLTGVKGNRGVGDGAILEMVHSDEYTGPTTLTVIHDDYKDSSRSTMTECLGLKKQ
jgi:hypothetical protein